MKFYRWLNTPAGTFISTLVVFNLMIWPGQLLWGHPMTTADVQTFAAMGMASAIINTAIVALRARRQLLRNMNSKDVHVSL